MGTIRGLIKQHDIVWHDQIVRTVKTGLSSGDRIQIVDGISPGDPVIAKAGAFLRGGDKVRAVIEPANGTAKKADIATGAADGEAR